MDALSFGTRLFTTSFLNYPDMPTDYSELQHPCGHPGCKRFFMTTGGRTKHIRTVHASIPQPSPSSSPSTSPSPHEPAPEEFEEPFGLDGWDQEFFGDPNKDLRWTGGSPSGTARPPSDSSDVDARFYGPGNKLYQNYHGQLTAVPCDEHGNFLPLNAIPKPKVSDLNNWTPYENRTQFEVAQFLYTCNQMSMAQMDILFYLWATTLRKHNDNPPFRNHSHLLHMIDKTPLGDVQWNRFAVEYTGEVPTTPDPPLWMQQQYKVWHRDPCEVVHRLLGNLEFAKELGLQLYRDFLSEGDEQHYRDFMSGDWAWQQAVSEILLAPGNN